MISAGFDKKLVWLAVSIAVLATPVWAETEVHREFELGPGGQLLVDTDNGSVSVVGTSGSTARVTIRSRRDDIESHYSMQFDSEPGRLEIRVDREGEGFLSWFGWTKGGGLKFEIEVPFDTAVDVDTAGGSIVVEGIRNRAGLDTSGGSITATKITGDVLADTSGGSIEVEEIGGDVNADTSGGTIQARHVRGDLRADTSGGSIRIEDVGGDIEAGTSGGTIRIEQAGAEVLAETSGGGISVSFAPGNDRGGRLDTSGGGITVNLDASVGLEIDAYSSGGSVVSDVPVTVRGKVSRTSLKGKLGSGGALLKLRTSGGGIRIRPL